MIYLPLLEETGYMPTERYAHEFTSQFVGIGTGPLHVPKLPDIAGLETFGGRAFHTSRWDYGYTGGDPAGAPMDRLAGQRVALIGTGATAVQCVPHLAAACGELLVFQRTPSSVDVRDNQPIDRAWPPCWPTSRAPTSRR
ncbi:MAG: hypothetical protein ACR2FU_17455 [Streptosporangiaceae bacterium]